MLHGQFAGSFHTVDGGSVARLQTLAHQQVASRTPPFLTNTPGAVERRPDILQIAGISWDQALRYRGHRFPVSPPTSPDSARIINLVEVGYGVDTLLGAKAAEKRRQHVALEEDLVHRGWEVRVHGIALGVSDALQHALCSSLWALGIRGGAINLVIQKLQRNAIRYCNAIHVQRRNLEHQLGVDLFSGGSYTGHGPPGARGGG